MDKADQEVARCTNTLRQCPEWGIHRGDRLADLADAHRKRFQLSGAVQDIELAVTYQRQALERCPVWNPQHVTFAGNLAAMTSFKFSRGEMGDVEEAIQCNRRLFGLLPRTHPEWATSLNNLAISVYERFQQRGDAADIDEAVQLHRKALALRPASHPDRASSLNNLATSMLERFQQGGSDVVDIDEAVQLHREALALRPAPHPDRANSLSNLANSVRARFQERQDAADIDESVQLYREALALCPAPHPSRAGSLNNLGSSILNRFRQRGLDAADIDEAVQLHREALALFPAPHRDRAKSLSNLADSVLERVRQRGDAADVDEAIQLHREALALRPALHAGRASSLSSLADSVLERFQQRGDVADIDEAVQLHREALALLPAPHPHRAISLNNLGRCFVSLYERTPLPDLLTSAMLSFEEASADSSAPLPVRFETAKRWASVAQQNHHASALDAYKIALGLLPRLVALDLDIRSRQEILVAAKTHDLGSEAAACAIDLDQYETALELLEAGRSVFWSQSLHLRTSLDELRASHPVLATKLAELSRQLDQHSFVIRAGTCSPTPITGSSVPGFEDFMQPRPIRGLRRAAEHGPVVVLNSGEVYCHALILNPLGTVQCVELPAIIRPDANMMAEMIQALASHSTPSSACLAILNKRGHDCAVDRLFGRLGVVYEGNVHPKDWFDYVLRVLWIAVVKPVLSSLKIQVGRSDSSKSDDPPRIWWCPTGPFTFLPIHAAGIYNEPSTDESVMDYAISSYTPTLTALLSPPFPRFTYNDPLRSTVIIQPNTPGHVPLPSTKDELRKIEGQIPNEWLTKLGSTASLNTVLPHLQMSSIIHFACHGIQDTQNPLQSALIIGRELLTVTQIMKQSGTFGGGTTQKHMGLAFLSACETAMGDKKLPDEAMHLAATLLFSGFRSVVATMWTMQDPDGPEVAEAFYGHLFRNADPNSNPPVFPELNDSAEALHLAVKKLRTHVSFARWVPFVHYGL
ncbi:CHAT domain-containing protein [Mycena vulgaris]|nr:CHAT domain-containing protein [Mycena vulgaris]